MFERKSTIITRGGGIRWLFEEGEEELDDDRIEWVVEVREDGDCMKQKWKNKMCNEVVYLNCCNR
jgi:hypothetical protein